MTVMRSERFPWRRVLPVILAGIGGLGATAWAQGKGPSPAAEAGIRRLVEQSGGTAQVRVHRATGAAGWVRLEPGRPALRGADLRARGHDFLRRYGDVFGIVDPDADLTPLDVRTDRHGYTHLRYRQVHRGVPVFAGELRLHFDPAGRLTAAHGTFLPDLDIDPVPRIPREEAERRAVAFVAGLAGEETAGGLRARGSDLVVFRTGLVRRVEGEARLAFRVEVGDGAQVREFVFVDAHAGRVLDRIPGVHTILDRRIHEPVLNNVVIWTEGDPLPYESGDPPNDVQVNTIIDSSENVYDLFANLSGGAFLSWDGASGTLNSVWNIPSNPQVPCPNAFWDGTAANFCNGVAPDDVVAHEWTHAYTESTHNLIYQWQSGALNESYSDIYGETIDLLNGTGSDFPGGARTDGSCSTLQPYPPVDLVVNAPASIAGPVGAAGARFNPAPPRTVTANVQLVNDGVGLTTDACQALIGFTAGRIALIDMGTACGNVTKVLNAQNAGASAVIIARTTNDSLSALGGFSGSITIPTVTIGLSSGNRIKAELAGGVNATVREIQPVDGTYRWLVSEDASAFGGAIRDMWNPPCLADPGKVGDSHLYVCGTFDNGGVHSNSGIPNHGYALLLDGGTFNGRTVAALGATKAANLYWRAMEIYQVPDTDFADHADSLEQACADLIGVVPPDLLTGLPSGPAFTAADCAAVTEAVEAVELRLDPTFCDFQPLLDPNPPAVDCGAMPFFADFETDPTGAWLRSDQGVYPVYVPRQWEWTAAVPAGGTGSAFFARNPLNLGNCDPATNDQSGVMRVQSPAVTLRAAQPVLTFDHYLATEMGWDGGNLKISVNNGPWQLVAPADYLFNAYNATLNSAAQGNSNPLAGQSAFTGTDGGRNRGSWGQSQVDLSPYAGTGDKVRLLFDLGSDGCFGIDGWYVDNVRMCQSCAGGLGADADADGYRVCDGDCNDADVTTHAGAAERNDGLDNECPGDLGFGLVDDLTGDAGFHNPADPTEYSWPPQAGAFMYQVARSTAPDFASGCTTFETAGTAIFDADALPPGGIFYYLVRPLLPFPGSWGRTSAGLPRVVPCS